ncbi:unannotated protein [freshwater metagenome]|uniref:L-threonylcarbamoyladenylate synthase n=1 Tax=freshwater metagenome TaxID=449393 RepID=A0A6J6UYT9_9ZZZZ|nr:hypothetical protein [Actinomycetota bacterium]
MFELIDILSGDREAHVDRALELVRAGYVIVAPLENGYVFLADAFIQDAVRTIHAIRGDDLGVAAQVLVGSTDVLDGIARDIPESARLLMEKFWPGQLSFNVLASQGLSWDLGDDGRLGYICVRVPSQGFVLDLVRKSGPLAVASTASAGSPPVLRTEDVHVNTGVLQRIFGQGELTPAALSTVISANGKTLTVLREGAVSLEELVQVVPEITGPKTTK